MKNIYLTILSFLLFLFIACNQNSTNEIPTNITNENNKTNTAKEEITKDTIFLNFTSDMTMENFNKNIEILANSGRSNISKSYHTQENGITDIYYKYIMIFNNNIDSFNISGYYYENEILGGFYQNGNIDFIELYQIFDYNRKVERLLQNLLDLYSKKYGKYKKESGTEEANYYIPIGSTEEYKKNIFNKYTWDSEPKLAIKYYSLYYYYLGKEKNKKLSIYYYSNRYFSKDIYFKNKKNQEKRKIEDDKKKKEANQMNDI